LIDGYADLKKTRQTVKETVRRLNADIPIPNNRFFCGLSDEGNKRRVLRVKVFY